MYGIHIGSALLLAPPFCQSLEHYLKIKLSSDGIDRLG